MHMRFQYIKCWLDRGFNNLDKINKKVQIFLCDLLLWGLNLNIASRNKIHVYGSRSENM